MQERIDDSLHAQMRAYIDGVKAALTKGKQVKKGDHSESRRDDRAAMGPGKRIGRGNAPKGPNAQGGRPTTTGERIRAQRGLDAKGGNDGKTPWQRQAVTGGARGPVAGPPTIDALVIAGVDNMNDVYHVILRQWGPEEAAAFRNNPEGYLRSKLASSPA